MGQKKALIILAAGLQPTETLGTIFPAHVLVFLNLFMSQFHFTCIAQDSLINMMDGISVMVWKFRKILIQKYTPRQLILNLSMFLEFSNYI